MIQFRLMANQVLILAVLILIGHTITHFSILTQQGLNNISKLIVKVCLPVLVFYNTISSTSKADVLSNLHIIPYTVFIYIILFFFGWLLSRLLALPPKQAGIFRMMMAFGNVGFIGIPIIMCLHPEVGMICISVFTLIDQPAMWTVGISLLHKDKDTLGNGFKHLLSPALISILLATIFIFLDLRLPSVLSTTLSLISGCTMPLSLIFLGGSLFFSDAKAILRFKSLYFLLLRMIIIPIGIFCALRFGGLQENLAQILTVLSALPCLSIAPTLAQQYDADIEYANAGVLLTTLFSIITLPLLILILNFLEQSLF